MIQIRAGAGIACTAIVFTLLQPMYGVGSGDAPTPPTVVSGAPSIDTASVKNYGAIGNGVVDDTTALQEALLSQYSNVFVPQGVYNVTRPLRIPSHKRMSLAGNATIRRVSNASAMLLNAADGTTGRYDAATDILIEGGTWDANGTVFPDACTVLGLGHASDVTIRDCRIVNIPAWHGIELNATQRGLIDGVEVRNCSNEAIQLDTMNSANYGVFPWFGPYDNTKCRDITIRNCLFEDVNTAIGSHSDPAVDNLLVETCVVNGSRGPALTPNGYKGVTIQNCQFNECYSAYKGAATGLVFRDNQVYAAKAFDVDVAACPSAVVEANTFVASKAGILGAGAGATLGDNKFDVAGFFAPAVIMGGNFRRIYAAGTATPEAGNAGTPIASASLAIAGSTPAVASVDSLEGVAMTVLASGTPPLTYQWFCDDVPIASATARQFVAVGPISGPARYHVRIANAEGETSSCPVLLVNTTVATSTQPALANLSARAYLPTSGATLTAGFVVKGSTPVRSLLRGVGPTLATYGIVDVVPTVDMTISTSAGLNRRMLAGWDSGLTSEFDLVGAFHLAASSGEAAGVVAVPPGSALLTASASHAGNVLLEIYDTGPHDTARLGNLSALGMVMRETPLIAGFSVRGEGTLRVLLRGIGPSLQSFGVANALSDVRIELADSSGAVVASNEGWSPDLRAAFGAAGAFPLQSNSRDAALVVELRAGASYSLIIRTRTAESGVALAEIYELHD